MNLSGEMVAVADPSTNVESGENLDVADLGDNGQVEPTGTEPTGTEPTEPPIVQDGDDGDSNQAQSGKTEADAAFAELRREKERLESENSLMRESLGYYFDGEDPTELALQAKAYNDNREYEDVKAEYEESERVAALEAQLKQLEEEKLDIQVEQLMAQSLRDVQQINPDIKSLEELGEDFVDFIAAGLSTKQAYYALKNMEANEKVHAPSGIGKISNNQVERDYYTSEELDKLTDEEMDKNWDKVMRSMSRLG